MARCTAIVSDGSFAPFECASVRPACPLLLRLCCKSRKLQGHDFFAKTRNRKQSPIRIDAVALSKSPVNLTLGNEVPHIFTRKPHLRPLEFLILGAKRLLQHNRSDSYQIGMRPHLSEGPKAVIGTQQDGSSKAPVAQRYVLLAVLLSQTALRSPSSYGSRSSCGRNGSKSFGLEMRNIELIL